MTSVIKPNMDKKKEMLLMRGLCVVFVLVSFFFSTQNISFIVNLMSFSWGVVAGAFLGPYLWGLYSKKITKVGAWSGMVIGPVFILAMIVFYTVTKGFSAAINQAALLGIIAMALSVVVTPLVSLFTKKFEQKHIETVFAPCDD
jgi:Na+/proline symporter